MTMGFGSDRFWRDEQEWNESDLRQPKSANCDPDQSDQLTVSGV